MGQQAANTRAVSIVGERMRSLVASHSNNVDVLELTEEVVRIFIETHTDVYETIDPKTILYDETARNELHRRMLIIKESGKRDVREGYGIVYKLIFSWRFKQLDWAAKEFARIVTVIYERNN